MIISLSGDLTASLGTDRKPGESGRTKECHDLVLDKQRMTKLDETFQSCVRNGELMSSEPP